MVSPTSLPLSLLTIILLVVPGLVGLELYYRRTSKRSNLSRTQRIVYSTFISISSIVLLYLLTPIYFEWLDSTIQLVTNKVNIATGDEISSISIPTFTVLYLVHIFLTLGLGLVVGIVDAKYLNPDRVLDRRPPWKYAFDEAKSEEIEVVLNDGTMIRGQFNEAAWAKDEQELYIEDPEEIEYEGEDLASDPVDIGRSVLLTESAISHILFVEEDPGVDRETDSELENQVKETLDNLLRDVGEQEKLDEFAVSRTEDSGPDSEDDQS